MKRKIVPVEPTEEMSNAGGERIVREYGESDWEEAKDVAESLNPNQIWSAMLSACPDTTEEDVERVALRVCARRNGDCPCATLKKRGLDPYICPSAKEDARAAIAAMLEG